MRPLKPYIVAFGGLIAAVFSALFLGAHAGVRLPIPASAPQPDLQAARRVAAPAEITANRDASSDRKTPTPQPFFPAAGFSRSETLTSAPQRDLCFQPALRARERLSDERLHLLVGTVELRI